MRTVLRYTELVVKTSAAVAFTFERRWSSATQADNTKPPEIPAEDRLVGFID